MNRVRQKHCWQCGKAFQTLDRYQNWCSVACEKEYQCNPNDYGKSPVSNQCRSLAGVVRGIPKDHESTFTHISDPFSAVMKEIADRLERRQRLEAERGRPISDQEFLTIARQTGLNL